VGIVAFAALHGLIGYMQNENAFALAFGIALLSLLLEHPEGAGPGASAGVLLGFACGLRVPAFTWMLPVGLLLASGPRRRVLHVLGGFLVAVAPWVLTYAILRGSPVWIPGGVYDVSTRILGWEVQTRPLNWPIFEHLVRVSEHQLPALFDVPIRALQSTGVLLGSAAAIGFALLRPAKGLRHPRATALAWFLPTAALLLVHVYSDFEKASYLLLGLPVFPLFLARFSHALTERGRTRAAVTWLVLAGALSAVPGLLVGIDVPPDPRAHSEYEVMAMNAESPSRVDAWNPESRAELARPNWLPGFQQVTTGAGLRNLLHPKGDPAFASGRILVKLDWRGPRDIAFPVQATAEAPVLPGMVQPSLSSYGDIVRLRIVVSLRMLSSPTVGVRLRSDWDALLVEIDPGPEPYEWRHVSFVVDDNLPDPSPDEPARGPRGACFDLRWNGRSVPARLGLVEVDRGSTREEFPFLLTNDPGVAIPTAEGAVPCYTGTCHFRVLSLESHAERTPCGTPR
jgi:hypothetical protein